MFIDVLINGRPFKMDASDPRLRYNRTVTENDNEKVTAVEYWLDGEMVHRSAHVELKAGSAAGALAALLG